MKCGKLLDGYFDCLFTSFASYFEFNSPIRKNMSDSSFDAFIMNNSHGPKIDDVQASYVCSDVDSSVHV